MTSFKMKATLAALLLAGSMVPAVSAETLKIGAIGSLSGGGTAWGLAIKRGAELAVDEVNKAGGLKVGDKTYNIELVMYDDQYTGQGGKTAAERLVFQDKVKFVFGPFLSNVFVTIFPYAQQFNGKFLMMGGGTRIHEFVGKPGNEFVIRTWNWDAGPKGFGEKMVDYLIKTAHPKKVAMLFQNDSGGKILGDIYEPIFKARGIETMTEYFEPGTKDFSPVLAKIAGFQPDYLFPGYSDAALYDIVRQSIEGNYSKKFFLVRGSTGPGLKNKDGLEDYIVYVPKDFEEAEKKEPKVKHFIDAYKAFYKRDFPYDQAPLCSSSCYDHVYMLVAAMQKAGSVDDVEKIRTTLLAMTYEGMWKISFDDHSEQVFDFDIVHLKKGGAKEVVHVEP